LKVSWSPLGFCRGSLGALLRILDASENPS
jgi:hypothetical protein